jgi:hypothetical protein
MPVGMRVRKPFLFARLSISAARECGDGDSGGASFNSSEDSLLVGSVLRTYTPLQVVGSPLGVSTIIALGDWLKYT